MPQNTASANVATTVNLARLARELAQDIREPEDIRKGTGLTPAQFEAILEDANFQKMLREMVLDWNSASGTAERVRVKAATAVEVALESFFVDVVNHDIPLAQRTEAMKALMKLGELGEKDAAIGPIGGGVNIQINLGIPGQGEPPKTVTIEAQTVEEGPALAGLSPETEIT